MGRALFLGAVFGEDADRWVSIRFLRESTFSGQRRCLKVFLRLCRSGLFLSTPKAQIPLERQQS